MKKVFFVLLMVMSVMIVSFATISASHVAGVIMEDDTFYIDHDTVPSVSIDYVLELESNSKKDFDNLTCYIKDGDGLLVYEGKYALIYTNQFTGYMDGLDLSKEQFMAYYNSRHDDKKCKLLIQLDNGTGEKICMYATKKFAELFK